MDAIKRELSRRNLLRYLGASVVYLPFMRTLMETQAFGAVEKKRAVFLFYPSGYVPGAFHPAETGAAFVLPASTKPLEAVRKDIIILKNVNYDMSGGIGSAHKRGNNHGLTGCSGAISNVSIDTYLGQKLPGQIPVLRLGAKSYIATNETQHFTVSFSSVSASGGSASVIEDNPTKAFNEIFGNSIQGLNNDMKKSLLDSNLEQINGLQRRLGSIEKSKLDNHISSIRELERRLQAVPAAGMSQCAKPLSQTRNFSAAEIAATSYFDMISSLQIEVAIQALACGVTNVVYLQLSHGTSGLDFFGGKPAVVAKGPDGKGGSRGHHSTSHFGEANSKAEHTANQAYMMGRLATLIKGMGAVKEGDKTLLYNSSVLAFSELADSDRHSHTNMGLVLAGQAGGHFKTGRCIDGTGYVQNNLLVSILQGMGLKDTKFGNKDNGKGAIPSLSKV